jgi:hypothetical protein
MQAAKKTLRMRQGPGAWTGKAGQDLGDPGSRDGFSLNPGLHSRRAPQWHVLRAQVRIDVQRRRNLKHHVIIYPEGQAIPDFMARWSATTCRGSTVVF